MIIRRHEREKVTDFLLIAIRDAIKTNPHLKVILMSATLDSEQFSRYFENCPVINVPGRMFDVEIMHLGDVLVSTGYKTKEMTKYMSDNPLPKILRTSQNMASIAESHKENGNNMFNNTQMHYSLTKISFCLFQNKEKFTSAMKTLNFTMNVWTSV